jgi:Spy/CpxP family protein refolding chaperone
MKMTLIASALSLMAMTSATTAQACGYFDPGQGPANCGMMQPGPAMGRGGRGPGGGGPGGNVDAHLQRMTVMLGLSPEQQAEIRAVLEVQQATRQAMQEAMRDAMKEQVDAVLTPGTACPA